jgi:peptide/nickel transport system substrate-binding protein
MKPKRILAPCLAVLACALIAGCGSSGSGPKDAPASPQAAGTSASGAAPQRIKIAYAAPVVSVDPSRTGGWSFDFFYGARLTSNGTGEEIGKPELAQSFEPSDGARTWTAKLRPDAKFSDGAPVTAADVVASFRHVTDDKASLWGYQLTGLTTMQTPDERTVVFQFARPYPSFGEIVSEHTFTIFPKAGLAQGESFFDKPISAGPYLIDRIDPNGHIVLKANPHYWGEPPTVKEIEYVLVPEAATRLAQVKNGDVDYATDLPGSLRPQVNGPVHAQILTYIGSTMMLVNHKSPTTGDARVRRAIDLAVDRQQVAAAGTQGLETPQRGYFPKSSGFADQSASAERDTDAAKDLLQGTSCAHGCELDVIYRNDVWWQQPTAAVLQQNLQDIGITVKLEGLTGPDSVERTNDGRFDVLLTSWNALVEAPDEYLDWSLSPKGTYMGARAHYRSKAMEQLIDEMRVADEADRPGIAARIEKLFAEDEPFIALTSTSAMNVTRPPDDVLNVDGPRRLRVQ